MLFQTICLFFKLVVGCDRAHQMVVTYFYFALVELQVQRGGNEQREKPLKILTADIKQMEAMMDFCRQRLIEKRHNSEHSTN